MPIAMCPARPNSILVDIGHPAHVHFFKNAIAAWRREGVRVHVTARSIPVAERLLQSCGIAYETLSTKRTGVLGLGFELLEHNARLYPRLRRWKIDVCVAVGGTFMIHAATLARCRRIVCYDTETATIANRLTFPFANAILTPRSYLHDLGPKQVRYRGYQELTHLHPNYFHPSPTVLDKYGLAPGSYSMVRLIAWEASHDIGLAVPSPDERRALVRALQQRGRVIVVPEGKAPDEFKNLVLPMEPQDFHTLLHYARWCISEGVATARESCLVGTPVLYLNPMRLGVTESLAAYGLMEKSPPGTDMLAALQRLTVRFPDKASALARAAAIVADHEDVTAFLLNYVKAG